jgi:phosphatidylglycerophosphatase A
MAKLEKHHKSRDALERLNWRNPLHWLATGFGSGLSPFAPGTFGTLAAILISGECLLDRVQLRRFFGQFFLRLRTEGAFQFVQAAFRLLHRRLRT